MAFFLQIPPPPDDGGPSWDSTFGIVVLVVLVHILSPIAAFVGYALLKERGFTDRQLLTGSSVAALGILLALLVRFIII